MNSSNRLQDSGSLYLRQHADNPVHWQPWDKTALAEARERDCPILLSIGYSACHWCHVMAHESFEDPATATVMNDLYVNIKVDREERPDLDKVYQLAHQLLTGRGGGWPLTVFLDPRDHGAFFAGTYFPPEPRHGMPAFPELLARVREWFDANRGSVRAQNRKLQEAIAGLQGGESAPDKVQPQELLQAAFEQMRARHDPEHGGFGGAPKFPQAPLLALASRMAASEAEHASETAAMLDLALESMATGGLRDHLDGGFFRYTVDGSWTIPHFEKMLYDNAQLLPLYAEAAVRTKRPLFAKVAEGIADWLLSEMRQEHGGFAASIDADADGVEGGFHVWDRAAVRTLLDADEYDAFAADFGLDDPPNFEGRHWHLLRKDGKLDGHAAALERLREARSEREPPTTDHKILTAWNALCIDGLARAGSLLDREPWVDAAIDCWQYLRRSAWKDGRLYAVIHEGRPAFPAYLDDHAFMLKATLSLLQARWMDQGLLLARGLAQDLLGRFEDADGGFRFTAEDQDSPVARLRVMQDDATPNGNALAAEALMDLAHLEGDARLLEAARKAVRAGLADAGRYPLGHASLLVALDHMERAPAQVLILGTDEEQKTAMRQIAGRFNQVNCFTLPAGASDLPALSGQEVPHEAAIALVCRDMRCLPPATSLESLERALADY